MNPDQKFGQPEILCLKPLLEAQEYVSGVSIWQNEPVRHSLDEFRNTKIPARTNIADAHLSSQNVPQEERDRAWLSVPQPQSHGRVVFARSTTRFDLPGFWQIARDRFPNAVFVGTPEEHDVITAIVGRIEFHQTADFLELAEFLSGAQCFVGNQSAPFAIAEGLKIPVIQEVDTWCPNCVFTRPGAFYVSSPRTLNTFATAKELPGNGQEIGIASSVIPEPGSHVGRLGPATLAGSSVIVVTYNSKSTIEACLQSVLATLGPHDELIVVDNDSTDGTKQWLTDFNHSNRMTVVLSERNLGFSAACNRGALLTKGQYITFLNPDTEVNPGWLQGLAARFIDPEVSAVGPVCDHVAGFQFIGFHLDPNNQTRHKGATGPTGSATPSGSVGRD